eukprot:275890-Amorphochlora_amoeboformis.AAC.4
MRLRCGRKHLFTWMMFVSLTISGIGGALLVLGSSLAGIFYLSNVFFICFIAVNILIFDWRGKQTYHEAATITFCAAAVSAGPFVATVGFLGLRSAAFCNSSPLCSSSLPLFCLIFFYHVFFSLPSSFTVDILNPTPYGMLYNRHADPRHGILPMHPRGRYLAVPRPRGPHPA